VCFTVVTSPMAAQSYEYASVTQPLRYPYLKLTMHGLLVTALSVAIIANDRNMILEGTTQKLK
jgi:hypothetical protein